MGGWQGALTAIGNTASNWGSTPSSNGGKQKSESGAWDAANKAAKRIADAIKSSSGKQGDSGATGSLDTEMNPVNYKKYNPKKHAKSKVCHKKHAHKKGCK